MRFLKKQFAIVNFVAFGFLLHFGIACASSGSLGDRFVNISFLQQYHLGNISFFQMLLLAGIALMVALGFSAYRHCRGSVGIVLSFGSVAALAWLIGTFMMLAAGTDEQIIFWNRIALAGLVFVPSLLYHFVAAFNETARNKKRNLIIAYCASLIFLLASQTDYFISGLLRYSWGAYGQAQVFCHLFAIFFAALCVLTLKATLDIADVKKDAVSAVRKKILFYANACLLLAGVFWLLPAYHIALFPFSVLVGVLSMIALACAASWRDQLHLKLIATELFFAYLGAYFLLNVVFAVTLGIAIANSFVFYAVVFFGALLARTLDTEIKVLANFQIANERARDITAHLEEKVAAQTVEVRAAYDAEKKEKEALADLDKTKTKLLLATQNQLRTLLTMVKGYIKDAVTARDATTVATIRDSLLKADVATDKMGHLINDVMESTQPSVSKETLVKKSVQIDRIVSKIGNELKRQINEKELNFSIMCNRDAAIAHVEADETKLSEALYSLIENAVKYTPRGGSVHVSVSLYTHPIEKTKFIKTIINDTGVGIERSQLAVLFSTLITRAQTVDGNGKASAAGLGLMFARNVIDAHGGWIEIQSEGVNQGTTAIVFLPL